MRALPLLDIGTRMTVVRLPDGGLLLHSPVEADAPTRAAVDALGPVRFVCAPNRVHHLYAGGWKTAYPDARLLGAPGLARKRRDLRFDGELGDAPDPAWGGVLDTLLLRGAPWLDEVAFLHRPTRTLLLTDSAFHPTPASRRGLRIWTTVSRVRGGFGPNAVARLAIRDRAAFRASLERVLAWDFDRVVVTHGEVLESGGEQALRRAYAWLPGG
ncbi:MAG: hypothetical protein DCC71_24285 [Proteobacteria bacterium]|nr:MAG: hypothetical protein DCC71_24285 [Pseudomonadota bacterium]